MSDISLKELKVPRWKYNIIVIIISRAYTIRVQQALYFNDFIREQCQCLKIGMI